MNALAIARAGFIELVRGKIYQLVLTCGAVLVAASLAMERLAAGMGGRVTADIGLAATSLVTAALATIVPLTTVAREIETRQVHLLVSRPVSRTQYVVGRFLTASALVVLTNAILGALLAALVVLEDGDHPARVWLASMFVSGEGVILVGIALAFGVRSSTSLSGAFVVAFFLICRLVPELHDVATRKLEGASRSLALALARALPDFTVFDLTAWLHDAPLPDGLAWRAPLSALLYATSFVALAAWRLERHDLL